MGSRGVQRAGGGLGRSSTSLVNPAGSFTARVGQDLAVEQDTGLLEAGHESQYESPASRQPALMRTIQSARALRFLALRSR